MDWAFCAHVRCDESPCVSSHAMTFVRSHTDCRHQKDASLCVRRRARGGPRISARMIPSRKASGVMRSRGAYTRLTPPTAEDGRKEPTSTSGKDCSSNSMSSHIWPGAVLSGSGWNRAGCRVVAGTLGTGSSRGSAATGAGSAGTSPVHGPSSTLGQPGKDSVESASFGWCTVSSTGHSSRTGPRWARLINAPRTDPKIYKVTSKPIISSMGIHSFGRECAAPGGCPPHGLSGVRPGRQPAT